MKTRLTSLFLVFMLGSSTFAGIPLHFGEGKCEIDGMMDCCRKALQANETPEVAAAKLCCAIDCATTGPTSSSVVRVTPPSFVQTPAYWATDRPLTIVSASWSQNEYVHGPPGSPPAYLLNLAFLI